MISYSFCNWDIRSPASRKEILFGIWEVNSSSRSIEPSFCLCFCPLPTPTKWDERAWLRRCSQLYETSCNIWAKEAGKISIPKLLAKHSVACGQMQNDSHHLCLTEELLGHITESKAPQPEYTCHLNHLR